MKHHFFNMLKRYVYLLVQHIKVYDSLWKTIKRKPNSIEDWLKSVDTLSSLTKQKYFDLIQKGTKPFDIDSWEICSYLYRVEKILSRIRESILSYSFYLKQYKKLHDDLICIEFAHAREVIIQCVLKISKIIKLLEKESNIANVSDDLISQVYMLELEKSTLDCAINNLNFVVSKLVGNCIVENISELKQSLNHEMGSKYNITTTQNYKAPIEAKPNTVEYLMVLSNKISNDQDAKLVIEVINTISFLKKCFVVVRRITINEIINQMSSDTEKLIYHLLGPESNEELFQHLDVLFHHIEALRFNSNRDNQSSRNLFEKAKLANRLLRRACLEHTLGRLYIKSKHHFYEKEIEPKQVR